MSRLCFLDIDGVLNSTVIGDWCQSGIDPEKVELLNELLIFDDLEFVLSSSWRKLYRLREVERMLVAAGFKGGLDGHTPAINNSRRGEEIVEYIRRWPARNIREIDGLVILDDDSDMEPIRHRLVQTRNSVGLTIDHVKAALKQLRDPFDWSELP